MPTFDPMVEIFAIVTPPTSSLIVILDPPLLLSTGLPAVSAPTVSKEEPFMGWVAIVRGPPLPTRN